MKPIKYPKCEVCGKTMREGYIIAYVVKGKQITNGKKVCSIECERKLK